MSADSTFKRRIESGAATVRFSFEGASIAARDGDSVAAALVAHGCLVVRNTPVSGESRGPYCMMGACFECLVEIDGEANRQACMTAVREGMLVRRMRGARTVRREPDAP